MKYLKVKMPDESKWIVPLSIIIQDRVEYYVNKRGEDEEEVTEETYKLFEDPTEVDDYASNNLNWSDISKHAAKIKDGIIDYDSGWANGDKEIVER